MSAFDGGLNFHQTHSILRSYASLPTPRSGMALGGIGSGGFENLGQ